MQIETIRCLQHNKKRGLIPKVTPKIQDSPDTFTIEWENSLEKAGLILTEKLRDYCKERARN